MHNTAEIGGALFAHSSSLHIVGSTYSYNRATFGGAIVTSETLVYNIIANSSFGNNEAVIYGGVMIAYKDLINISGTTLTDNRATKFNSGLIEAYVSLFSFTNSTFIRAETFHGLIFVCNASFSIRGMVFLVTTEQSEMVSCLHWLPHFLF